jgi:hypothetical protein
MTRHRPCHLTAAFLFVTVSISCAHASGVAYVSQASPKAAHAPALQPALEGDAETIVLLGNYSIENEFDEFLTQPLRLNRYAERLRMLGAPMPAAEAAT